ncbi:DUF3347 domain-containing protein [Gramella lutea]|uniref:DUF3347 domain-containing protein n=1 Tax=Christiangramia lutea TaxID=1607951 RepID=A0A9X1V5K0_9FLAO|nr:DUF3347 domain-containing protein [Christiangramia lutea]MCH4824523.1 DUF3347 domain-containing protein [Christiangramia lutea]
MRKSIKSLFSISLVAGSLLVTSCGDSNKKEDNSSEEMQEMTQEQEAPDEASKKMAKAEFSSDNVTQAYEEYLAVKDALVQTDAEAAAEAAKNLQVKTADSNRKIAEIAGKLASESDVNVQRETFSELTAAMDPVLKEAISSGKIYKQFCPMAFEGKGDYWYASSEEIRNPYFGDKMLKCGRVDETIE